MKKRLSLPLLVLSAGLLLASCSFSSSRTSSVSSETSTALSSSSSSEGTSSEATTSSQSSSTQATSSEQTSTPAETSEESSSSKGQETSKTTQEASSEPSSSSSDEGEGSVSETSVASSTDETQESEEESTFSSELSSIDGTQSFDNGTFSIATEDGSFSVTGETLTILSGGTYVLTGSWHGMIYGDLSDDDTVELDLNGVTLTNDENSCIYFLNADKLKIKALESTTNQVIDQRALQTSEDDAQGGGAIYAKCDTNFVGKGALEVTGTFNNGIHVTKDLSVKNVTLDVSAPNNVLKGNDSVTIESGTITLVSSGGDGIKTVDSDLSSKGNQRGSIDIQGGTISISSAYDGIDAAYDVNVSGGDLTIRTNEYRTKSVTTKATAGFGPGGQGGPGGPGGGGGMPGGEGSSSEKAELSAKGIKAANQIVISGGSIDIASYDDAIHANDDNALDSGATPLGNITFTGGETTIIASDDGIHADGTLRIEDGIIDITESWEGIEANVIDIVGGETSAYASNDAANASSAINVSGGYLFAEVPTSGDNDGIDSNGTITISGGTVIACGPNNMNMAAIDADYTVKVTGGTLVAFGYASPTSSLTKSSKSGTYGGKAYTLTFANGTVTTKTLTSTGYSGCTTWSVLGSLSSIS